MTGSWWRRAVVLLIALLTAAGLFLAWTSYNFSYQLRRTVLEENSRSAQMWANFIESRTDTVYEHIHELLVTLYNNTELKADTPVMSAQTKVKIVDMMDDKLLVSDYADAFFVFDTQNDFFLFSAKNSISGTDTIAVKNFIHENSTLQATPFGDKSWQVIRVNGRLYFSKGVQLGKYIVGAVSSCSYYGIEQNFSVLGTDLSCQLLIGDTFFDIGGGPVAGRWEEASDIREGYHGGLATVTAPVSAVNGTAVLSVRPEKFTSSSLLYILLVANSALCVVLAVILLSVLRRKVARPTRTLIHANQELASGNTDFRLRKEDAGSQEYEALYDSFNTMADQIVDLRIQAYDLKLREEQNKLTMLRAQVKPHSFLNAVTTISNMTYINRPEEIRSYIASFAKFIRYMLKVTSPWTTLAEELDHIRNYLKMQQIRAPEGIHCTIDCQEDIGTARIPFLMLYTLVENSIKHAMTLYEPMELKLTCRHVRTPGFTGLILTEEDSGAGFPPEVIEQLLSADPDSIYTKEHLGLTNVRYTLNLIYRRSDLLRISNRERGGARVEILIPEEEVK